MSDRLTELQRQRALVQVHLTWLDQEIASAEGSPASPEPKPVTPTPSTNPQSFTVAAATDTDALLAKYGNETTDTVQSVRKGCYVFFAFALILLFLGVYCFYLIKHWNN